MPHFIHDTCIGCTACATKCPTEAIIGDKKTLHVIIDEKCIGCALCAEICPHEAITMTDAAEAKQMMAAGIINAFYVRNAGPDNVGPPVVVPPKPAPKQTATVESAT